MGHVKIIQILHKKILKNTFILFPPKSLKFRETLNTAPYQLKQQTHALLFFLRTQNNKPNPNLKSTHHKKQSPLLLPMLPCISFLFFHNQRESSIIKCSLSLSPSKFASFSCLQSTTSFSLAHSGPGLKPF